MTAANAVEAGILCIAAVAITAPRAAISRGSHQEAAPAMICTAANATTTSGGLSRLRAGSKGRSALLTRHIPMAPATHTAKDAVRRASP